MIATIKGRPSEPARTEDSRVPPPPTQIANGSCKGRGDTPCPVKTGGGRKDHRGCRVEELLAMVLTDPEHVQSDLIGVFDLFEQIAQTIRLTDREASLGQRRREAVNANFHLVCRNKGLCRIVPMAIRV